MMRATKDSGIAWIGDIPGCWEIDKLKYHLIDTLNNTHQRKSPSIALWSDAR